MTYRYDELTWQDVQEAVATDPVLVIPVGTTEQHGPHLPLSVDTICASEIASAAVGHSYPSALLLPTVAYAFNQNQMDFPATISIDMEVFVSYMACIGRSLAKHGFRHVLFVNGHGSNIPFLDAAARRVNNETECLCAVVTWWMLLRPDDLAWRESRHPGGMGHACELETSMILHLRPELVEMEKAVDDIGTPMSEHFWFDLTGSGPVSLTEYYSRHSTSGVSGEPTFARPEKGAAAFAAAVRGLVAVIEEFQARPVLPLQELTKR
jgi:creatinine amidohydrolase